MRNVLIVACVGMFAVSMVGCGDASSSSGIQRRGGAPSNIGGGVSDGEDDSDQDTPDTGNTNATTPPPAPTTPGTGAAAFDMALSTATPNVNLGEQVEITVTITPKAGATGDADLTVTGLPADATGTFAPAKVTLGAAPVTSKLTVKVPVTAVPSAPNTSSAIVVAAKQGTAQATANANFKINPAVKLTIPVNIDALRTTGTVYLDQWGTAFGANPQALKTQAGNGIVVTVFNADSKQHIVHGNNGFTHGSTTAGQEIQPNSFEMQNGAPRTRTLNVGANVNGYPHEGANGTSAAFRMSVVAAP